MQKATDDYSQQTSSESAREWCTNIQQGLDSTEVAKRFEQYGHNEVIVLRDSEFKTVLVS